MREIRRPAFIQSGYEKGLPKPNVIFFPTKAQWRKWTLPSKLGAIGAYAGVIGLVLLFVWPWLSGDTAKQDSRHAEVMRALNNRNDSLKNQLWDKYPYGYVLFGSAGGDIVSMPFYKGDLFVDAKWEQTRIEPDYSNKLVRVSIFQPQWKQDSGPVVHVNVREHATSTFPLKRGVPIPFRFVYVLNQPQMLFETLDDNQRSPVYVIGFRKQ